MSVLDREGPTCMQGGCVIEVTGGYILGAEEDMQMEDVILPCSECVVTTTDAA